jgi:exodeoxyribonuclease V gamma subunit
LLSRQLIEQQPGPLETVEVMVNTWPTSRWLGEQLATANGISSLVRFPFPGSRLRQLVRQVLHLPAQEDDPWRAGQLVWAVLELLPELLEQPVAQSLRVWLTQREGTASGLTRDRWQLARTIADAMDDYALYRPDQLEQWKRPRPDDDWQPVLWRLLAQRLPRAPFGLQVREAVDRLRRGDVDPALLPERLRLFGISALAPVQVDLIQALSGLLEVEIYLLTPCPDLWQRCGSRRASLGDDWLVPPDGGWLAEAPRFEAVLGRMGAEFQQLLEGSGEAQLGERREGDLFAGSLQIAAGGRASAHPARSASAAAGGCRQRPELERSSDDQSLLFQAAPGPWREVQLVRDRILQWLAADPDLAPRDVLVMTPQIERYAPLLSSVFNDTAAIGVDLPWRLTDRSQQSSPGLSMAMFTLLELAATRLTATGLERLLANPALQGQQGLTPGGGGADHPDAATQRFSLGLGCPRAGRGRGAQPALVSRPLAAGSGAAGGARAWLQQGRHRSSRSWIPIAWCAGGRSWTVWRGCSIACDSPGRAMTGCSCCSPCCRSCSLRVGPGPMSRRAGRRPLRSGDCGPMTAPWTSMQPWPWRCCRRPCRWTAVASVTAVAPSPSVPWSRCGRFPTRWWF